MYLHSFADLLGCLPCDFRVADKQVTGTIEHLQAVISAFHTWYKQQYNAFLLTQVVLHYMIPRILTLLPIFISINSSI
jgi:hypothetical protein